MKDANNRIPDKEPRVIADKARESARVATRTSGEAHNIAVEAIQQGKSMDWDNKDSYAGKWHKGKPHGVGVGHFFVGNERSDYTAYAGEHYDGLPDGVGVFHYANGEAYRGQVCEGRKHGKGVFYYRDKIEYAGEFYKDKPHGKGIIYFANGTSRAVYYDNGRELSC